MPVQFIFSEKQKSYFFRKKQKTYNLMVKGRRSGFTHGCAAFIVRDCLKKQEDGGPMLWVDTIEKNIVRYYERFFRPYLRQVDPSLWEWRQQQKELSINGHLIDFRSAEKPENIEGFAYEKIFINEAGIVLKGERGRYLWENAITPMMMDYEGCQLYIGGVPKGMKDTGTDSGLSKFYELYLESKKDPDFAYTHSTAFDNPFLNKQQVKKVIEKLPKGPVRDQEGHGKFIESGLGFINGYWFQKVDLPIEGRRCRSWDLAFTKKKANDYVAGALCCKGDDKFQVQDIKRFKEKWPETKKLIIATAEADGPDIEILVEESGTQIGYVDDLKAVSKLARFSIVGVSPIGDKMSRSMPWVTRLESGHVNLLRGMWNADFITEAESFTADDSHDHDDQIDAVSQAYQHMNEATVRVRSL